MGVDNQRSCKQINSIIMMKLAILFIGIACVLMNGVTAGKMWKPEGCMAVAFGDHIFKVGDCILRKENINYNRDDALVPCLQITFGEEFNERVQKYMSCEAKGR